ncbi:MAG: hypothetical protein KME12_10685 [Trichocoleus desertorum ATA4-8-CV12]|nr:hypothetical protein [Trichocoleus desertorum ATA4-8-CV12]
MPNLSLRLAPLRSHFSSKSTWVPEIDRSYVGRSLNLPRHFSGNFPSGGVAFPYTSYLNKTFMPWSSKLEFIKSSLQEDLSFLRENLIQEALTFL